MASQLNQSAEVIYFFERGNIAREMLYSEFEAILDGFIPVVDLVDTSVNAVYLQVGAGLNIRAAVFFIIDFDAQGFADKRWNVPLVQLADSAGPGPNLGAGAIRLACYSQCQIAWHQAKLWDPDMQPGRGHFSLLKKKLKANTLHLRLEPEAVTQATPLQAVKYPSPDPEKLQQKMEEAFRVRIAEHLKQQRLRANTLLSRHQQELQRLGLEHNQRIETMRDEFLALRRQLDEERALNGQLKSLVKDQAAKVASLQAYFEQRLRSSTQGNHQQLEALRANYELALQTTVESETASLNEQLQSRDIEIMYHREQQRSLMTEIDQLRHEKAELLDSTSDQLLTRMQANGVTFVTYQLGAGHITLDKEDVPAFLQDADAFVATTLGVSKSHLLQWRDHYQQPCCQALVRGGGLCGERVRRIESPAEFHMGESDRCSAHQSNPLASYVARA